MFYHLDKLKQNDGIVVYWEGKKYIYKVTETKIVTPNQTEIEKNTDKNILTLYTCTPLWTAENRLVVIAEGNVMKEWHRTVLLLLIMIAAISFIIWVTNANTSEITGAR